MKFSSQFANVHRKIAPNTAIAKFADVVDPVAIGFNTRADFYDPVQINVRFCDEETLRFAVPVKDNATWRQDLQLAIGTMLPTKSQIELRTINDIPLRTISDEHLHCLGNLNIYADANATEPIRLQSIQSDSIPTQYSVLKQHQLKEWVGAVVGSDALIDEIAAHLQPKDVHEIEIAVMNNGDIQSMITKRITSSVEDWSLFAQKNHINAGVRVDSKAVLEQVSKHLMASVQSALAAHSDEINRHVTFRKATKAVGSAYVPVVISESKQNSFDFFRNIAKHALTSPALQECVFNDVYRSPHQSGRHAYRSTKASITNTLNHHPRNALIHHTIVPVKGVFPADYLTRHTHVDMSPEAPYNGNASKTYALYHGLLQVHRVPPARIIKASIPQPLGCGLHKHIVGSKKSNKEDEDLDEEMQIGCGLHNKKSNKEDEDLDKEMQIGCGLHKKSNKDNKSKDDADLDEELLGAQLISLENVAADMNSRLIPTQGLVSNAFAGVDMNKAPPVKQKVPSSSDAPPVRQKVPLSAEYAPPVRQKSGLVPLSAEHMEAPPVRQKSGLVPLSSYAEVKPKSGLIPLSSEHAPPVKPKSGLVPLSSYAEVKPKSGLSSYADVRQKAPPVKPRQHMPVGDTDDMSDLFPDVCLKK